MKQTKLLPARLGMDILSNELSLISGEKGSTVREIRNLDLDRDGNMTPREGFYQLSSAPCHSLYYSRLRRELFVMVGATLHKVSDPSLPGELTTTPLATLGSAHRVSYCEHNGDLFLTNRTSTGWIRLDDTGVVRPIGQPAPNPAPTATGMSNGALDKGDYAYVVTLTDDAGVEGPATAVRTTSVPEGGSILFVDLPLITDFTTNLYITTAGGSTLALAASFPSLQSQYRVAHHPVGATCGTQFLVPLPAGDLIATLAGRIYTAKDDVLSFSGAMNPLYHSHYDTIKFTGKITILAPVSDGLFVADARGIWFLDGLDPSKQNLRHVAPTRCVFRSSVAVESTYLDPEKVDPGMGVQVWLSEMGYIAGKPGGAIIPLNADRIQMSADVAGRSCFTTRYGRHSIVTPIIPLTGDRTHVAADFDLGDIPSEL